MSSNTNINLLRRSVIWFNSLKGSERIIVSTTLCVGLLMLCYFPVQGFLDYTKRSERIINARTQDLEDLNSILTRYEDLQKNLNKVQATFEKSQMTLEQITADLDKIVKNSIGSNKYELLPPRSPSQIGFEFEKQEFTLKFDLLSLDELTKLLFYLEQGKSPLFISKVDINKLARDGEFKAVLEIFSVRKLSA